MQQPFVPVGALLVLHHLRHVQRGSVTALEQRGSGAPGTPNHSGETTNISGNAWRMCVWRRRQAHLQRSTSTSSPRRLFFRSSSSASSSFFCCAMRHPTPLFLGTSKSDGSVQYFFSLTKPLSCFFRRSTCYWTWNTRKVTPSTAHTSDRQLVLCLVDKL